LGDSMAKEGDAADKTVDERTQLDLDSLEEPALFLRSEDMFL
jgi:hypothetical protein